MQDINKSVQIIMEKWIEAKQNELIHFITDENHIKEVDAFSKWASDNNIVLKATILPSHLVQDGQIIEQMTNILKKDDVIIGATSHSFITTNAVKSAINNGARFLSLPLSCNDGSSMLERDFISMDPEIASKDGEKILKAYQNKKTVHVTTALGTDLSFSIEGRNAGGFYGLTNKAKTKSSSSFEVFIAPNEDSMNGVLYLDGSFGYIGTVNSPIKIEIKNGTIISASSSDDGADKLISYIESFNDKTMYKPGEFGIGLNRLSKCAGVCYIEDESVYGTFHLGLGRNLSLGGIQASKGHFDIVTFKPTIYFDEEIVMKDGELV